MSLYEDVKKALQDLVIPEIRTLHVEIKRLDERIDLVDKNLRERFDIFEKKLGQKFEFLDEKISGIKAYLGDKDDSIQSLMMSELRRVDSSIENLRVQLQTAIEIRERLASLEGRMGMGVEVA